MKKTLEMTFRDAAGKSVAISLPDPKSGLTASQVKTAMQDIVDRNVFVAKGGELVQVVEAKIRVLDVTDLV